MKRILFQSFAILLALTLMASCSKRRNNAPMMKNVTGKAGELVVVMAADQWKGEAGQVTKDLLAQPQLGLPQDEPLFNLITIPHEAFGDIFKTTRALMIVRIAPEEKENIIFKNDVYAFLQNTVTISANSTANYLKIIENNRDKILTYFLSGERKRLSYNYERYSDKEITEKIGKKFNLKMNVPPGFVSAQEDTDFIWYRYETPDISQGILIYSFPYDSDSTFTENYQLAKRNIYTHRYVPGPTPESYMVTENQTPFLFSPTKHHGNYATELRGLWRVENDFMGGPFVNLAILDLLNNRVVVLDGFVYAPGKDKRNYIRQVEAIIYSAEFLNQDDIDKVNKQMDI